MRGTAPPRCSAHTSDPANKQTHSAYAQPDRPPADLDALIEDLERRVAGLSAYIDAHTELSPEQFSALLRLQGELTSRIGRLMRDRAHLARDAAGRDAEALEQAINEALDAAAAVLDVEL
jgi:hypothetical protein